MLKHKLVLVGCLAFASVSVWAADAAVELKTDKDRLSYSIGASIAKNFKKDSADIDIDMLVRGLKDSMAGSKLAIDEKEIRSILGNYQNELRQHAMANRQVALVENKKKGDAFLEENKKKKGVVTLENGLQYRILKKGDGPKAIDSSMVDVFYRGTLIDGKEFDSTEPGKFATLKVSSLIAGWKQALVMMPTGSRWEIVVPSQLAYGDRGAGSDIGPNEVLKFEVELVKVR